MNIGILGGGQLARMLAQSAFQQGHTPHIYSEFASDPAAQVTRFWHSSSSTKLSNKTTLPNKTSFKKFLRSIDVLCFEHEFCDIPFILDCNKSIKTKIYPNPMLIAKIQDRLEQKKQFIKYNLPTAAFMPVNNWSEAQKAFAVFVTDNTNASDARATTSDARATTASKGIVLKARRFGYDGYSTFYIKTKKELLSYKKMISSSCYGFIAEPYCQFKQELAFMVARSIKGEIIFMPLVQTHQKNSKCLWTKGPVKNKSVEALKQKIKKYLTGTKYVGVMAFELFDLANKRQDFKGSSQILINEVAPRVHNSGHYSMNSLTEDQFSLHLRCITGGQIQTPKAISKGFAMHNLIGSSVPVRFSKNSDFWLHWYGKQKNNHGRKMGHINVVDSNPSKALKKAITRAKEFKL